MGRKPKNTEDAFSYDLRAKVPKSVYEELKAEAEGGMKDKSQIVREAVVEHLAKLRAKRERQQKGKQG